MAKAPDMVVTITHETQQRRLSADEITKHAEEYAAPAVALIRKILEKQARAMIEQLQDELTKDLPPQTRSNL